MPDNKKKEDAPLRVVKPKTKKFGLSVPVVRYPHNDFLPKPDQSETLTSQPSVPSHTRLSEPDVKRSFQKVPNSISKKAIPEGLFKPGKSKHLYDVLLGLTRADIAPKFSVRLSKTKLRKLAGIGSRVTFDSCVEHLESVGLIKVDVRSGEHEGNIFEVFFPEEITQPSVTSMSRLSSQPSHTLFLDRLDSLESSQTSHSLNVSKETTSEHSKTFIKDNTKNDDEAHLADTFGLMAMRLNSAVEKFTGKSSSKVEAEKWGNLADLLILELEVAAGQTGNISSVPAFLTEVLRRQFFAARRETSKSSKKQNAKFVDSVGKSSVDGIDDSFEIKSLDTAGREAAVSDLLEFKNHPELLEGFEKWYTPEDWDWLLNELKK